MTETPTSATEAIAYAVEPRLPVEEFHAVLVASTLGERRPVQDRVRLAEMLRNANLILTARSGGRLVGVARAITDFCYCCYVSDLAVDSACQRQGIGRRLLEEVRRAAGERVMVILLAAPAAEKYYPHIGMQHAPSCWIYPRSR